MQAKKSKNKKKKKKAKAGPVDQLASEAATPTSGPGTPSKKSGSKAAPDSAKKDAYSEMDDIDLALAEIASKTGGAAVEEATAARAVTAKALDLKWTKVKEVFSFDPKFLDADAELRRMFGSKVVSCDFAPGGLNRSSLRFDRSTRRQQLHDQVTTLDSQTTRTTRRRFAARLRSSPSPRPAGPPPPESSPSLDIPAPNPSPTLASGGRTSTLNGTVKPN